MDRRIKIVYASKSNLLKERRRKKNISPRYLFLIFPGNDKLFALNMEDVYKTCQALLTCLRGLFSGHTLEKCASAKIYMYMLHTTSSPTEVNRG